MNVYLTGTVRDGVGAVLMPQRISWPRGEAGTIVIALKHADGSIFDTSGVTGVIAVRPKGTVGKADGRPLMARQATPLVTSEGTLSAAITQGDTLDWEEGKTYRFDVHAVGGAIGSARTQVIAESDFRLEPIVSLPTDPPSAP